MVVDYSTIESLAAIKITFKLLAYPLTFAKVSTLKRAGGRCHELDFPIPSPSVKASIQLDPMSAGVVDDDLGMKRLQFSIHRKTSLIS